MSKDYYLYNVLNSDQILPIIPECAAVPKEQRTDCGWGGITRKQCLDKGCCFDNTQQGVNWCFHPEGNVVNILW